MSFYPVDFADTHATESFVDKIRSSKFDILVNNAGINKVAPFANIAPKDFDLIHLVNVRAPFRLCQAVIPYMLEQRWGRIVNVSSIFGIVSREHRASYSTSKFAIDGMTAALAAEVAQFGILANCVAPGFIDTELTRSILGTQGIADLADRIPARRLGQAEEVASLVCWLCSPENTYISGQRLVIDGGFVRV
ncbi:3-oxoacyl-(acyl-carrier-like protein) reductase [Raphidiopsis brookii D9]|nr:3-oxoacyl-(acyl-carrier-like protein) reductase [Raphidiopsis brookii D9]